MRSQSLVTRKSGSTLNKGELSSSFLCDNLLSISEAMNAVPRPPVSQEQESDDLYQELCSGMAQSSHRASQPDRADKALKRRPRSARKQESKRITSPDEDYILLPTTDDSIATDMSVNPNNMFPSFLETPPNARLPQSPVASQQPNGNGGMNGMSVGMPLNAGHQMDVNMLYQKVLELSEVLRENREQTQGIVAGAEELAVRHFRYTRLSKPLLIGRMSERLEQRRTVLRPCYKKPMPKFPVSHHSSFKRITMFPLTATSQLPALPISNANSQQSKIKSAPSSVNKKKTPNSSVNTRPQLGLLSKWSVTTPLLTSRRRLPCHCSITSFSKKKKMHI